MLVRHAWPTSSFAYELCRRADGSFQAVILAAGEALAPPSNVRVVGDKIAALMNNNFASLHVRRGDKLNPKKWPNLDKDTQAQAILRNVNVTTQIKRGRTLYICTNEREPGFFDALKLRYHVVLATVDFPQVLQDHGIDPRSYHMAAIDSYVCSLGKPNLETFNDLTSDPRAGYALKTTTKRVVH